MKTNTLQEKVFVLFLLLAGSVGLACFSVPPVYAQTVSISNLQYPSSIVANRQLTVSFTVEYSGASAKDYLILWIYAQNSFATGSVVSSSPQACQQAAEAPYSSETLCALQPSSGQGSEDVAFSLSDPSGGMFSFNARAVLGYTSSTCSSTDDVCIDADSGNQPFSVSVMSTYTLTVNVPGQVSITLDGVQQPTPGSIAPQLSPGTHQISVPNIVQIDSTSRLKFEGWSDGSNQTTRVFDLESDDEITAAYVTQYLVTATTDSSLESGWYNAGTVLQLSVSQTRLWARYRVLTGGFDGWYANGELMSKSVTTSFTVNGPVSLTAIWNFFPYLVLIPIIIAAVVCAALFLSRGGIIPSLELPKLNTDKRSRKRTRRTKPKPETYKSDKANLVTHAAESGREATKPRKSKVMHCTQCGATIPRDSKFCKECGSKQT